MDTKVARSPLVSSTLSKVDSDAEVLGHEEGIADVDRTSRLRVCKGGGRLDPRARLPFPTRGCMCSWQRWDRETRRQIGCSGIGRLHVTLLCLGQNKRDSLFEILRRLCVTEATMRLCAQMRETAAAVEMQPEASGSNGRRLPTDSAMTARSPTRLPQQ